MDLTLPKLWLIVRSASPLASKFPGLESSTCSKRAITLVTAEVREEISELIAVERDTSPDALEDASEDNAVERDASAF